MSKERSNLLQTFSTYFDTLIQESQTLLFALQVSLYLHHENTGHFHLEICSGSSPLDLRDEFDPQVWQEEVMDFAPAEILAVRRGEMVFRAMANHHESWFRVAMPVVIPEKEGKKVLGVLVMDSTESSYPTWVREPDNPLREFCQRISIGLRTILENELPPSPETPWKDLLDKKEMRIDVRIAQALAAELKVPMGEIENLTLAVCLRDIGYQRFGCAFHSENKKLSPEEWEEMRKHPLYSEEMLRTAELPETVRLAVRHHHESIDGQGYPDQLRNGEISLGARILSVTDAYCALISDRPYRRAKEKIEALQILQTRAGIQFDPQVIEVLPLAIIRAQLESG